MLPPFTALFRYSIFRHPEARHAACDCDRDCDCDYREDGLARSTAPPPGTIGYTGRVVAPSASHRETCVTHLPCGGTAHWMDGEGRGTQILGLVFVSKLSLKR